MKIARFIETRSPAIVPFKLEKKRKAKRKVRGVSRNTRRQNFSNKNTRTDDKYRKDRVAAAVVDARSKFNIYIVMARVRSPTRYSIRLCHRRISRELKFPPFRLFALFTQYPRLNPGATRQVAPIVCHDLRFTAAKRRAVRSARSARSFVHRPK